MILITWYFLIFLCQIYTKFYSWLSIWLLGHNPKSVIIIFKLYTCKSKWHYNPITHKLICSTGPWGCSSFSYSPLQRLSWHFLHTGLSFQFSTVSALICFTPCNNYNNSDKLLYLQVAGYENYMQFQWTLHLVWCIPEERTILVGECICFGNTTSTQLHYTPYLLLHVVISVYIGVDQCEPCQDGYWWCFMTKPDHQKVAKWWHLMICHEISQGLSNFCNTMTDRFWPDCREKGNFCLFFFLFFRSLFPDLLIGFAMLW